MLKNRLPISSLFIILILFIVYFPALTKQTILITSPTLQQPSIPYSYANIGSIPYGKTLSFDLIQNNINLCQPSSLKHQNHLLSPTYLLVDSTFGTCSFTTQAINAQQLGAKGVIFVSDMVNHYDKIIQVDDGNGRKIHITVLFISTMTYRQLHSLQNIKIKVLFETHKSQIVNITYFLSASGRANYITLRQLKPYLITLDQNIKFRPVYMTTKCPNCNPRDCLISSDYCTFQLETYQDFAGEFILREQLKQWSIWKSYGTEKYIEYMDLFDRFCSVNWEQAKECGDIILRDIGIEEQVKIQGTPSEMMDQWRIQQVAAGFLSTPELTINEELYAGSYSPEEIFSTICQTFITQPYECPESNPSSETKIGWIIAAIILASILTLVIIYFIYIKCIKKQLTNEMFSKVNELVAKYATQVQQHNKKRKDRLKMRLNEEI